MTTQDDFTTFWKAYPRRLTTPRITGKRKARDKCKYLVRASVVTWGELIAGAKAYAKCDNVLAGYVKLPMTWLNDDGWDYEYDSLPDEGSHDWQRNRCHDAGTGRFGLDNFDKYYRSRISPTIQAEFPQLYFKLRAVK